MRAIISRASDTYDVNATDHLGWTPLHEACNHKAGSRAAAGALECAQLLLAHDGVEPVDLLAKAGDEGVTALHEAVMNNSLDLVEAILQSCKTSKGNHGQELLQCCTNEGLNPMQLATTDEMRQLLASAFKRISGNALSAVVTPLKLSGVSPLRLAGEEAVGLICNALRKYASSFSLHFVREDMKLKREGDRRFAAGRAVLGREELVRYGLERTDRVEATDLRSFNELHNAEVRLAPRLRTLAVVMGKR